MEGASGTRVATKFSAMHSTERSLAVRFGRISPVDAARLSPDRYDASD